MHKQPEQHGWAELLSASWAPEQAPLSAQAVVLAQEPRQARMLRRGWAPGQHRLPFVLVTGHTPAAHSGHTSLLGQCWAPGQHRLPAVLATGHTPAVRSGRTRAPGQLQPRGMVRLRCLHAHGASMKRQALVPQPWSLYWSSAGLQGSIGCPSDITLDRCTLAQPYKFCTPCSFICHAYDSHQGSKASQQVVAMQLHALTLSYSFLHCPSVA